MTLSNEGSQKWKISFTAVADKQFEKLDSPIRRKINRYIADHLTKEINPRYFGKPLYGNARDFWRFRVGDYRLVCELHDHILTIIVVKVAHRREVYKNLHLLRPPA